MNQKGSWKRYLLYACVSLWHSGRPCAGFVVLKRTHQEQGYQVSFESEPLVGGPLWLPLHVKVVLEFDELQQGEIINGATPHRRLHKFDFVPRNARESQTIFKLLSLQWMPADLRYFPPVTPVQACCTSTETEMIELVQKFCRNYPEKKLHLLWNNCWNFAFQLLFHILTADLQGGRVTAK